MATAKLQSRTSNSYVSATWLEQLWVYLISFITTDPWAPLPNNTHIAQPPSKDPSDISTSAFTLVVFWGKIPLIQLEAIWRGWLSHILLLFPLLDFWVMFKLPSSIIIKVASTFSLVNALVSAKSAPSWLASFLPSLVFTTYWWFFLRSSLLPTITTTTLGAAYSLIPSTQRFIFSNVSCFVIS